MPKGKKRKQQPPPEGKSNIPWLWLTFLGVTALVFYQYLNETDLCEDGVEVPAKVLGITSTITEGGQYGRDIKVFNVELGYSVNGQSVSVIKTFNDGEVYKYFDVGVKVGDVVVVLVDEEEPKRYRLGITCR